MRRAGAELARSVSSRTRETALLVRQLPGRRPSVTDVDHHVQLAHGDIRITHNTGDDVWLVYWNPDEGIPGYSGRTYDSTTGECPAGPDLDGMLAWVLLQPWANPPPPTDSGDRSE